jgi:hypothetical protein
MMVREVAKRTQIISDFNPRINRQTALERDLFISGRVSLPSLNDSVNNELNLPEINANAVLYTIEPAQDFK